ncbi:hypothetical protein CO115_03145 [Candidatus Falkowbacteria bacterium CG_4_9_14_3_um_filter_36_9]|nr:MAG: hypothetical protein CO115_03145 [Candidatus Falkowbacteria bacterium CG_4_9_14_3_um_filter_36_9]
MSPKLVIILSVAIIFLVGTLFIAIPKTSIVDQGKELSPDSTISIQSGFLTQVDSVRVFQTKTKATNIIAGLQDIEVSGVLSEENGIYFFRPDNGFNMDSLYRVKVLSYSKHPLLNVFGINNEKKVVFKSWTTPKIMRISHIDSEGNVIDIKDFYQTDRFVNNFEFTFSRPMNIQETKIQVNDNYYEIEWSGKKKALIKTLLLPGSYCITVTGKDTEGHPYIEGISVNFETILPKSNLEFPRIEKVGSQIAIVFPSNKVLASTGILFNNESYRVAMIGGEFLNGKYRNTVNFEGVPGLSSDNGSFPIPYLTGLSTICSIGQQSFQLEENEYISGNGILSVGINDDFVSDNYGNMFIILEK